MKMAIQIEQRFPKCSRCGVMLHASAPRIVLRDAGRARHLCSERCRDEYLALTSLADRGEWMDGSRSSRRRTAS